MSPQPEFVEFLFSSDTWRKKIINWKHPSGGSLKTFVELFKGTFEEVYSSATLQTFNLQLEMILKLLPMNSFSRFC